jgi:hypothetical protein
MLRSKSARAESVRKQLSKKGLGGVVSAIGFLRGARARCFSALPTQLEFCTKSGLI